MDRKRTSGRDFDVVVVGGGNAALCAALAARESGATVCVLERASVEESGGNSRFTAGAIRFAYAGLDDLRRVVTDLSEKEIETTDFGTYTEDQFFDDMFRVTQYRCDPDMVETLVRQSLPTIVWMREPRRPTHAPTGSMFESIERTATFERMPASRAMFLIWTMPSWISGISFSKSRRRNSLSPRDTMT